MVMERPPTTEMPMEVEPLKEAEPVEATPAEAVPAEEAPRGAAPLEGVPGEASLMEEVSGDASPTEEVSEDASPAEATPRREGRGSESRAESARDRRPEPIENVVERQIGGKIFKLGRLLSQEEQDEVAAVPGRICMVRLGHARHRPRFSVPPSHHGPQGPSCTTEEEEVQRKEAPRPAGRNKEAAECWTHQGNSIP